MSLSMCNYSISFWIFSVFLSGSHRNMADKTSRMLQIQQAHIVIDDDDDEMMECLRFEEAYFNYLHQLQVDTQPGDGEPIDSETSQPGEEDDPVKKMAEAPPCPASSIVVGLQRQNTQMHRRTSTQPEFFAYPAGKYRNFKELYDDYQLQVDTQPADAEPADSDTSQPAGGDGLTPNSAIVIDDGPPSTAKPEAEIPLSLIDCELHDYLLYEEEFLREMQLRRTAVNHVDKPRSTAKPNNRKRARDAP